MAPDHNPAVRWPLPRPIVIPYSRYSNLSQSQGLSLERQRQENEEVATSLGLPLDEEQIDEGLSGYSGANRLYGVLGSIKNRIKGGDIARGSVLLIDSMDRLGRLSLDEAIPQFFQFVSEWEVSIYVKKSRTHYTRDRIRSRDGMNEMVIAILEMGRAFSESDEKSRIIGWTKEKRREQARLGKMRVLTAMAPAWIEVHGEKPNRWFERNIPRCIILNEIFELSLSIGVEAIARLFNERWRAGDMTYAPWGLDRPRYRRVDGQRVRIDGQGSSGWAGAFIGNLLTDGRARGIWQPVRKSVHTMAERKNGKGPKQQPVAVGDPIVDYYPRAIGDDLYEAVRAARMAPGRNKIGKGVISGGRKGNGFPNLLSGLCTCTLCNGTMIYRSTTVAARGYTFSYLVCKSYRTGQGCTNKTRHVYPRLERAIIDEKHHLIDLLFEPGELTSGPSATVRETEAELARLSDRRKILMRNLREYDDEQSDIIRTARRDDYLAWATERMAIDQKLTDLRRMLDTSKGAETHQADADAVRRLWAQAIVSEGAERFNIRSRLNSALRSVVDYVYLDGARNALFVVGGGAKYIMLTDDDEIQVSYYDGQGGIWHAHADGFVKNGAADPQLVRMMDVLARRSPARRNRFFTWLEQHAKHGRTAD